MESYNNLELSGEWKLLKSMEKTTYAYRVDTSNKPTKKNYNIMQKMETKFSRSKDFLP